MSKTVRGVDVLFLHETNNGYLVSGYRDNESLFQGKLEVGETSAGPRPKRFRVTDGGSDDHRQPDEFIELARRSDKIRISEQTSAAGRSELLDLFDGFQLAASIVRTCRYCSGKGHYTPITSDTAITSGDDQICRECAVGELEQELAYHGGLTAAAKERLIELLYSVQDVDRITDLLSGELDPAVTKFDEISATVEDVDLVPVDSLDLHSALHDLVRDRFETLLPVQSLAVQNGLLEGRDQLVVSATATGKTLVGEFAGIDRVLKGEGKMLFLVPLVALANQKYRDFTREYGDLVDVTLRVGANRIQDDSVSFDSDADVIVGTYEGIDHALRTGRSLGTIGTVVIDEIHSLTAPERGHRLDGLLARLGYYCETNAANTGSDTQWIYLSATVGNPNELASWLDAALIEFEERPVPIERHVTFASGLDKPEIEDSLVSRAFNQESSKGYRGQTIIFTNSRRRCHEISRQLTYESAAYHAGLDGAERNRVENAFANQELAAVVTTAALAAGVDFPASQVIFDSLAMGIEWLTVQEFHQMLGRAGRPDYHDTGTVWLLVEPNGQYHANMERTEDEVAFSLLNDEMDSVHVEYTQEAAAEETLANIQVAGTDAKTLSDSMLGDIDTVQAIGALLTDGFVSGTTPTRVGSVVTKHFLSPGEANTILESLTTDTDPFDIVCAVDQLDANE